MKHLIILIVCLVVFSSFTGCQDNNVISGADVAQQKFPDFLVGTWKSDNHRWVFTFEPDGRISTMTHYVGITFDVEKKELQETWNEDVDAFYLLGFCQAHYDCATGNLDVKVNIDNYVISFPNGELRGSFTDHLWGVVSQDELNWKVSWYSHATVEEGGSIDPNSVELRQDTFLKVPSEQNNLAGDG